MTTAFQANAFQSTAFQSELVFTSFGMPFLYQANSWYNLGIYLEVYMRASSGIVEAQLYNITDDAALSTSIVTTSENTMQLLRSSKITLQHNKQYIIQFKGNGYFIGAKLIIK